MAYYKSESKLLVRYYETDQMGIVHHSNYIRYFECGRTECMIKAGMPIEKVEELGVELPVVSVSAVYKYPAKMGDELTIVSEIVKEPTARMEIFTTIYNQDGKLLCEGTVILGFLSKATGRPTRVPAHFLEAFNNASLCNNNQ